MRVSLFITCLADTLLPSTGQATATVLERLGHTVDFPREQTCCGQRHANTGFQAQAVPLVRCFARADAEVIVTPSGSCAAMVRERAVAQAPGPTCAITVVRC